MYVLSVYIYVIIWLLIVVINCGVPGLPAVNSYGLSLFYSTVTYGSTVTYSCISGYNIVGNLIRTCTVSGSWSGNAPECQGQFNNLNFFMLSVNLVVDCGEPYVPNGAVGGLTTNYGSTIVNSTATYRCNTIGYQLIGEAISVCSVNGTWTGTVPSCQCELRLWMMTILNLIISVISCGVPDLPLINSSGLTLIYFTLTYGSTVTYSCNVGYNLVGSPNRTCTASGNWSGTPPQCQSEQSI